MALPPRRPPHVGLLQFAVVLVALATLALAQTPPEVVDAASETSVGAADAAASLATAQDATATAATAGEIITPQQASARSRQCSSCSSSPVAPVCAEVNGISITVASRCIAECQELTNIREGACEDLAAGARLCSA